MLSWLVIYSLLAQQISGVIARRNDRSNLGSL